MDTKDKGNVVQENDTNQEQSKPSFIKDCDIEKDLEELILKITYQSC